VGEPLTGPAQGDLGRALRLDGKAAIVTGAAQRIGREIAHTFASQGARVLVADIQDELGERSVAQIRAAGGEASFVHNDVRQHVDIQAMIGTAVERFGRLDILVNNAHWEKHGSVVELEVRLASQFRYAAEGTLSRLQMRHS
jgi:NAD(P)-dependent dehydrogenase (short-subunit alcohol dehydrogenase family)